MKRALPFEKYEAAGNDFILLDFFEHSGVDIEEASLLRGMCHRHFGAGADGVLVLRPFQGADFEMLYFNSDGRPSSFCGNGARAAVAYMSGKQGKELLCFSAFDGIHRGWVEGTQIGVSMRDMHSWKYMSEGFFVDSGSPHLVVREGNPWEIDVVKEGRQRRMLFGAEGANVNFYDQDATGLRIATYERGVEAETLACGTGIVATALASNLECGRRGSIRTLVRAKGGELEVTMQLSDSLAQGVELVGPANYVYTGFYNL
ncbi:MAG: diaminopimelate epimerase [Saprospiraceae bacterium]|nr:diaminopimelate epimerase [Saprospiraceae bacterium]